MTRLPPDPVQQTTDRLAALNQTLALIAESGKDPNQQSKDERDSRKLLRKEVYAEIQRLVGPDETITLGTLPPLEFHKRAPGKAPPFDPPHPLPTDSDREEMRIGGPHAGL